MMTSRFTLSTSILAAISLLSHVCSAQELRLRQNFPVPQHLRPAPRAAPGQQLLILQNSDGQGGIRVIERSTNRQLVNTNNLREFEGDTGVGAEDLDEGLVAGLLDWFEKLKEKFGKKKKNNNNNQPIILPVQPHRQERKEIHIHINNHMKKQPQHKHKQGHYEHYHEGHYQNDEHDKHYHGKHAFPLLGHHFGFGLGLLGHGGGGHHHDSDDDYYSAYESKPVARVSKALAKSAQKTPAKRLAAAAAPRDKSVENQSQSALGSSNVRSLSLRSAGRVGAFVG